MKRKYLDQKLRASIVNKNHWTWSCKRVHTITAENMSKLSEHNLKLMDALRRPSQSPFSCKRRKDRIQSDGCRESPEIHLDSMSRWMWMGLCAGRARLRCNVPAHQTLVLCDRIEIRNIYVDIEGTVGDSWLHSLVDRMSNGDGRKDCHMAISCCAEGGSLAGNPSWYVGRTGALWSKSSEVKFINVGVCS